MLWMSTCCRVCTCMCAAWHLCLSPNVGKMMDRQVSIWGGTVSRPPHSSSHSADRFTVTRCGDLQAACGCLETIPGLRGEIALEKDWFNPETKGLQENKSLIVPRAKRRRSFVWSFVWEMAFVFAGRRRTHACFCVFDKQLSHSACTVRYLWGCYPCERLWVSLCPCLSFH